MMIRTFLLSLLGVCTLVYSAHTLWDYWQYTQWNKQVSLENIEWQIVSEDVDSHTFKANYHYRFNEIDHHSAYAFKKPIFINLLGAEHALADFSDGYKTAWISSDHPENSTLQKIYPLKEMISTGILWVIFCYFWLMPLLYRTH